MFITLTAASEKQEKLDAVYTSIFALSEEKLASGKLGTKVQFITGAGMTCLESKEKIKDEIKRLRQLEGK